MIHEDDFFGDDIFKMMDRLFGNVSPTHRTSYTKYIDLGCSERQIDDDNIYYTICMPRLEEEDYNLEIHYDNIIIHINLLGEEDSVTLKTPKNIIPDKTVSTYCNGLLDIVAPIDKDTNED